MTVILDYFKSLSTNEIIELLSTVLGLAYLLFLMLNKVITWIFGITSSLLAAYLFYDASLIAEMTTYLFYVVLGFYGWWFWVFGKKSTSSKLPIIDYSLKIHLISIVVSFVLSLVVGFLLDKYTASTVPYFDAFTSVFALFATYLEAKKVLSGWLYWIVINLCTIFLYLSKDFESLSFLMMVYTVLSVVGYIKWRKEYKLQKIEG